MTPPRVIGGQAKIFGSDQLIARPGWAWHAAVVKVLYIHLIYMYMYSPASPHSQPKSTPASLSLSLRCRPGPRPDSVSKVLSTLAQFAYIPSTNHLLLLSSSPRGDSIAVAQPSVPVPGPRHIAARKPAWTAHCARRPLLHECSHRPVILHCQLQLPAAQERQHP